jgi:2-amino-4-hydroxy-6-hydroxymethyldihydropteridine diphosphokinase/dihydropteroate synthase
MQVLSHSALYETAPWSPPDMAIEQPSYLNAALLAQTDLQPLELLSLLKRVENEAGRDLGGVRFGPRPLDLDIIFYGGLEVRLNHSGQSALEIPHPRWKERSFVKAPVSDLHPRSNGTLLSGSSSVSPMLAEVLSSWSHDGKIKRDASEPGDVMRRVLPLPRGRFITWGGKTHVMGILNATPDSFSDGGQLVDPHRDQAGAIDQAVSIARQRVQEGADILDIGGQSTRPNSTRVPADEELSRVVPLIRAIRQAHDLRDVVLSVDTYSSRVAREAVLLGVDIVNDVSGGRMDPLMLNTVDELQVPYISMHMRGDPSTMQSSSNISYPDGCTWKGVLEELNDNIDRAMSAGIPAWALVADPGLGFSKSAAGNIDMIRHLGSIKGLMHGPLKQGPILMGPSRKSFLGKILDRETKPSERDAASLSASVACVASGLVDIIRTHNIKDMVDGLRVADAVFRHQ